MIQEPTSGLDSEIAYSLMSTLDNYARLSQKTVITTIHQPSSQIFHMFNKLLLLVNGQVPLGVVSILVNFGIGDGYVFVNVQQG